MTPQSSKLLKVIAVSLVICVMQVYVMTNPAASAQSATTSIVLGKLILSGNQTILVNGNSASTGTTILSGSQLQTPDGVRGSVQLGEAGRLSLEANTNLTVTFDSSNVDVKVLQGNAFLAAYPGVKGTVTTPDGKTTTSTTSYFPAPQNDADDDDDDDTGVAVVIGGIGMIVIILAAVYLVDDDDSP